MAEIVWLASYPKSGNTWFRSLLTALRNDDGVTPDINRLLGNMIVGWERIELSLGIPATELTKDEVVDLRPLYVEAWAKSIDDQEFAYLKTHDALGTTRHGAVSVPASVTRCALYLVRNPLDVCVSYAHHSASDPARMLRNLNRSGHVLAGRTEVLGHQVPQPVGTWSDHVDSWTVGAPFSVATVRYEDMVARPVETLVAVLPTIGFDVTTAQVEQAVAATSMEQLRAAEDEHGFNEKTLESERFFRRGEVGGYRDELTDDEIDAIVDAHRVTMTRFGYLDPSGALTV